VLEVEGLTAGYGPRQIVVRDVSFSIEPGVITAMLGPNGAGKTTTLLTVAGELRPYGGGIRLDGEDVGRLRSHQRMKSGLVLVPQERNLFPGLSVDDHITLAGHTVRRRDGASAVKQRIGEAFTLFPALDDKRHARAGSLSGGQQQQLAIARALISGPQYLLLDEPLGLDPLTTQQIMRSLRTLAAAGMGVLLVEQQAAAALDIAEDVLVLQGGAIRARSTAAELRSDRKLLDIYLGGA